MTEHMQMRDDVFGDDRTSLIDGNLDRDKRRQVLRGARDVFLKRGFEGASMEQIAKAAGVSKGTLYVYFPSKEALFEALTLEEKKNLAENFLSLESPSGDPRADLGSLARAHVRALIDDDHMASVRMVIGVVNSFPEFGERFYEAGPCVGIRKISNYLVRETEAGRLNVQNPDIAAGHFFDLTTSRLLRQMLMCPNFSVKLDDIDTTIESGLDVFMSHYGVK